MTRQLLFQRGGIDVGKPEGESSTPYIVRIMQDGSDCCLHTIEGKPMDYVLLNEGIFCIRLESQASIPLLAKMEVDGVLSRSNYRLLPYGSHTIRDIRTTLDERSIPLHYSRNKRHFEGCGATEDVINGICDIDYYCGLFRIFFFGVSETVGGRWMIDSTVPLSVVMLRYGYYPHFQKVFPDCIPPFQGGVRRAKPKLRDDARIYRICREYPTPGISGYPLRTISGLPQRYYYGESSSHSPYDNYTRLLPQRPCSPTQPLPNQYTEKPIEENGKLVLHDAARSQPMSCISTGSVRSRMVSSPELQSSSIRGFRDFHPNLSIKLQLPGSMNYNPEDNVFVVNTTIADENEYMMQQNDTRTSSQYHPIRSQSEVCTYEPDRSSNGQLSSLKPTNSSDGYKFVIEVSPLSAVKRSNSGNAEKKPIAERPSYSEDQSVTNTANTNHNTSVDISDDPVPNQTVDKQEILTVEKKPTAIPDNIDISQPSSIASQQCNGSLLTKDIVGLSRTVSEELPEKKNTKSELEKAKEETLHWKRMYRDLAFAHERHDVSGLVSLSATTADANGSLDLQRSIYRRISLSKELNDSMDISPRKGSASTDVLNRTLSNSTRPSANERDLEPICHNFRKHLSGSGRMEEKSKQSDGATGGGEIVWTGI